MQERILIADDDKHTRELMEAFLANEGFSVRSFSNGYDLLAQVEKETPCLVILDVMMPGMDGLNTCAALRQRAPELPIIIVSAKAIEQRVFPDPTQAAGVILEESQRLTDVVNSMLTLSRLESQQAAELEPISLEELAADRLEAWRPQAGALRLELSAKEKALRALGQETLAETVLDNLLSNALRYAGRQVTVRIWQAGGSAMLAVENDGPAIAPELLPHIFERFYKGSDGNFGLGLPIAQNAARCMGGSLTVKNIPGTGVRFTLRLPAAGGESA